MENMEKPALTHETASLIQDPSELVKVELNVDDSSAYNAATVTIKEEPYDPSYDEFERTPQPQEDTYSQSADSSSSFSRTQVVKQESEQQNSAVIETDEHLLHIKTEPEAEPDEEMTEVEDEASDDEEEDKELQQFDVGSEPEEESYESEEASDEDEPRHKRIKMAQHKCLHCQKVFDEEELLNRHLYKVPHARPEEPHSCPKCGECVKCRTHLWAHLLMHKGQMPQICKDCGMVFKTKEAVMKHVLCKHTKDIHPCKMCQEKFESNLALVDHLMIQHGVSGENESFSNNSQSKEDLLNYSLSHNDTKAFICKQCMQVFETMESLATHSCGLEQCSLCLMTFSSKQQLQKHTQLHNVKEGYKACLECGITFPSRRQNLHVKIYHKNGPFPCKMCKKIFGNQSDVELHKCSEDEYRREGAYFCEECNLEFNSWPIVISHWNVGHRHECAVCANKFSTLDVLSEHMKECKESRMEDSSQNMLPNHMKEYKESRMEDTSKNVLPKHMNETKDSSEEASSLSDLHAEQEIRLFKCNLCTLTFKSNHTLSEHVKFCRKINCRCTECGLQFNSQKEMHAHRRKTHVYQCNKCNMRVDNRSGLHKHMVSVHGAANKCLDCRMEFKTISEMRKHSLDAHGNIRPFKCKLCDKMFKTKVGLTLHVAGSCKGKKSQDQSQDVDTLDEPSFSAQDDFSSHVSTEHFVPCTHCGESFRDTAELCAHYAVKHGEREQNYHKNGPFACKTCNKIFANKSGVMLHKCSEDTQRKEQGVYFCEKCNLELTSWPDVISHWNKIHIYRCPVCKKGFLSPNTLAKHRRCGELGMEGTMCSKNTEESLDTSVKPSSSSQFAAKQKSVVYKYGRCSVPAKRKEEPPKDSLSPNDNAFVCKLCTKTFNTKESLTTHICDLEQCNLCMMTFSSKHQLQEHMKLHNINEGHRVCLECEITFPSKEKHGEHMRTYHKGVSFSCEKCNRTFGYKSQLDLHKCSRITYSKYDGVPFCEKCNLEFKSWTDAISHRNKTHVYMCGMCSKRFMSQYTLTKHMKECEGSSVEASTSSDLGTDEKIQLYKCSRCTVVFKSKESLLEHTKMCVIKDISRCPECGMQFDSLPEMQAHMRNSHAYKCDKCVVTFASRSEFEKHAASVHAGSIYNCLKCGMGFRKMCHVMKHSLEAHNINPFKNDKFGKMGVRKPRKGLRLQTNDHSVTMENCPLVCNLCQIQFTGHEDFMRHMNAEHVVPCILCGDSFKDSSELWRHYAVKHGEGSEMVLETFAEDAAESVENLDDEASETSNVHQVQSSKEEVDVQAEAFSSVNEMMKETPALIRHEKVNSVTQNDGLSVSSVAKKNLRQYGRKANGIQTVPICATNIVIRQQKEDSVGEVAASQSGFSGDRAKKNIRQYGRRANSSLVRKVKTEPEDVASEKLQLWPQAGASEEAESSDTEFILPD